MNQRAGAVCTLVIVFLAAQISAQTPSGKSAAASSTGQVKPTHKAATLVAHPPNLPENAPASACNECHSGLTSGKYVHYSAMAMGCATCHQNENKGGSTYITLVNRRSSFVQPATPCRRTQCCTAHTWASAQDICLGCHARARLKVNPAAKAVTTPWGKMLTLGEMRGWMYLNLNRTLPAIIPYPGTR